jgi:putative transposase
MSGVDLHLWFQTQIASQVAACNRLKKKPSIKGLYSANKQQADRFYKVVKKHKKYAISIRNDLIRIEHNPTRIAEYWVRIPVKLIKGGCICESKLYKKDNRWFLDVVVKKDIPEKLQYQNVIGIDMGIRHIATSVELTSTKTKFYGKDLNRVRGHHFWLRRKLGINKAIDTIKKIGSHEKRIANAIIHKPSSQ